MTPKASSKPPLLVRFGNKVRMERKKRGISQEHLAESSGISRVYCGQIERGEKNITLMNIERIAQALKMKTETLMKF
ncbi:MAG: helix-turn-helix transcriptional regulator [Nitrospinae bacterium]|nr:helix-turn-helix transcriptional regulator [Nitrospinota bacterium]